MAAILGGTMRAPFTASVFALETTHDWTTAVPVFLASISAAAVTVLWIPRSIQMEKVALRGVHVARACEVMTLERKPVAEATDLGEIARAAGERAQEGVARRVHPVPRVTAGARVHDAVAAMARSDVEAVLVEQVAHRHVGAPQSRDYRRWTNTQGQRQFHLSVAAWCCRPTKIQVRGDAGSSLRKPRSAGSGRFVST